MSRKVLHSEKDVESFLLSHPAAMLFYESPDRRIAPVLDALGELLHDRFEEEKILIIASSGAILREWRDGLESRKGRKRLRWTFIRGSDAERRRGLESGAELFFITHESVEWLAKEGEWRFPCVVIDEFNRYKKPQTKRVRKFCEIRPAIRRMTGLLTPGSIEDPVDLWGMALLLDGGKRLGMSRSEFYGRYFFTTYIGRKLIRELREGACGSIRDKLADICSCVREENHRDNLQYYDMYVKLPPSVFSVYRVIEAQENSNGADFVPSFRRNGAEVARRMQIANGIMYMEQAEVKIIHREKLRMLERIREMYRGKRMLAVYWFRHEKQFIEDRFPGIYPMETYGDVLKWRRGEIHHGLIHADSHMEELGGADALVWFSLPWSSAVYEGTIRAVKEGYDAKMQVYHILAESTIDERILGDLQNKRAEVELCCLT